MWGSGLEKVVPEQDLESRSREERKGSGYNTVGEDMEMCNAIVWLVGQCPQWWVSSTTPGPRESSLER